MNPSPASRPGRPLRRSGPAIAAVAAAAIGLTWLLLPLARAPGHTLLLLPAVAAVAAAAARWPAGSLLGLAAAVPIAGWLGRFLWPAAWPELLVLSVLLGVWARTALRGGPTPPPRLTAPAVAAAVVVVGSLLVQLLVEQRTIGPAAFRAEYLDGARQDFFTARHVYVSLDAAMRLLESLALFLSFAAYTRFDRRRLEPLAVAVALGGGAAALLTLHRLWLGALRLDEAVGTFVRYLATIRLNVHYGDLNAAGSYYLLVLAAAAGLSLRRRGRWWLACVGLAAAGLWISGSRAALAAGVLAGSGVFLFRHWRRTGGWPRRRLALSAAAVAVAVLGLVLLLPERGNQQGSPTAVLVRAELARASGRMVAAAPAFGIGIGQYPKRSGEFASPALLALFPPARSENAHNNYLQVLAELGVVGFAVFAWLIATASRQVLSTSRHDRDPLPWCLTAGLVGFGLTCLAGHPLLINEPAFTFWLLLGACAGAGSPAGTRLRSSRRRHLVVAAIALVAFVTVPSRASRQIRGLDLEHVGIGVSVWEVGADGIRYRSAGAQSTVFLPAGAPSVNLPLRTLGSSERRVALRLDGRPADVVVVPADRWLRLRLQMPDRPDRPRFHRLDLEVEASPGVEGDLLMIGKVEPQ